MVLEFRKAWRREDAAPFLYARSSTHPFKWGEKGFYTFYTFYNVNNEIFIYSTYILQTFYKILQNAVFVKTFYKLLHFLHNFYNCRSLIKL